MCPSEQAEAWHPLQKHWANAMLAQRLTQGLPEQLFFPLKPLCTTLQQCKDGIGPIPIVIVKCVTQVLTLCWTALQETEGHCSYCSDHQRHHRC